MKPYGFINKSKNNNWLEWSAGSKSASGNKTKSSIKRAFRRTHKGRARMDCKNVIQQHVRAYHAEETME